MATRGLSALKNLYETKHARQREFVSSMSWDVIRCCKDESISYIWQTIVSILDIFHMQYHADTKGSNHQPFPPEFFVLPCFELQKQQHAACCSIISVGIWTFWVQQREWNNAQVSNCCNIRDKQVLTNPIGQSIACHLQLISLQMQILLWNGGMSPVFSDFPGRQPEVLFWSLTCSLVIWASGWSKTQKGWSLSFCRCSNGLRTEFISLLRMLLQPNAWRKWRISVWKIDSSSSDCTRKQCCVSWGLW